MVVRDEPPQKMSKLSIAAETETDKYNFETSVKCFECNVEKVDTTSSKIHAVVEGIMKANTFARQEEVKAWEQVYESCEHILMLQQHEKRQIQSQDLGSCSSCDLKENLWLCLECGNLGCGRAQFGGLSGHSHGVAHKESTGHAVAVKLGSITSEGTADVYCYACDEERIDEDLASHLAHWGIILAERQKTEKSLTEMQIEQNLRWEFSMTNDDGTEAEKLYGPGFTGLKNLGNSCYLASTFQCLFALPQFQARYNLPDADTILTEDAAQNFEVQMRKMADGLLSGRYAFPDPSAHTTEASEIASQRGLAPSMLKVLIGKGHAEFSTMRQQDAFEFLLHVFQLITRSKHQAPQEDPTKAFRFVMEQRLQCLKCSKVRYRTDEQDNISVPIPVRKIAKTEESTEEGDKKDEYEAITLKECLDIFTGVENVELTCSSCGSKDGFSKRTLFKTFPEVLAINARRIVVVNWAPTKVNVPVIVGDAPFNLDDYKSSGKQDFEELLPEEASESKPSFVPNEESAQFLEGMGFPRNRCVKALHATGNTDANTAMEWLFAHMEDADIDDPMPEDLAIAAAEAQFSPESVEMLEGMGFDSAFARRGLKETGGDVERAVDWLFSHPEAQGEVESDTAVASESVSKEIPGSSELPATFELHSIICHKGPSTHSGYVEHFPNLIRELNLTFSSHYVAFIRKITEDATTPSWVLFNDEKVVKALDVEEMKKFAYVYFFQRK